VVGENKRGLYYYSVCIYSNNIMWQGHKLFSVTQPPHGPTDVMSSGVLAWGRSIKDVL